VGGTTEADVDVRILAATNADIETAVEQGRFRRDLYYRLNVIRIEIPPLRERPEDLALLVDVFIRRFAAEQGHAAQGISKEAFRALAAHRFDGNVRELENVIERAVALSDGPMLRLDDLPENVTGSTSSAGGALFDLPEAGCKLDEVLAGFERRLVLQALERCGGVRTNAARLLGITFRSLRYRLNKLQLEGDDDAPDSVPDAAEEEVDTSDGRGTSPARGNR
jgi:two-component system response regulator PilR (NtrC family)